MTWLGRFNSIARVCGFVFVHEVDMKTKRHVRWHVMAWRKYLERCESAAALVVVEKVRWFTKHHRPVCPGMLECELCRVLRGYDDIVKKGSGNSGD